MHYLSLLCLILLSLSVRAQNSEIKPVIIASFKHVSPSILEMEKLVSAMYKKAGIPHQFKRFSMARALIEAKEGRVDALLGHPEGTENIVVGLEPIGTTLKVQRFALFSTKLKSNNYNNYKIVVLRGMPYVEKALEDKGIRFTTHPEVKSIAELIRLDRYDTTIMSIENDEWARKKVGNLKQVSDVILEFPIVHYVSKKRPEVISKFKALIQ